MVANQNVIYMKLWNLIKISTFLFTTQETQCKENVIQSEIQWSGHAKGRWTSSWWLLFIATKFKELSSHISFVLVYKRRNANEVVDLNPNSVSTGKWYLRGIHFCHSFEPFDLLSFFKGMLIILKNPCYQVCHQYNLKMTKKLMIYIYYTKLAIPMISISYTKLTILMISISYTKFLVWRYVHDHI